MTASGRRSRALTAFTLIASLSVGYAIAFLQFRLPAWACGVFSSSNTAAWVQGVGTVLAVLGTGLVAWWQRQQHLKDLANDTDRQAHALAVELVPVLDEDRASLTKIEHRRLGTTVDDARKLVAEVREKRLDVVPELLGQMLYQVHVLGKSGKLLLKVCSRIRRISATTKKLDLQLRKERRPLLQEEFDSGRYLPNLQKYLSEQRRDIKTALDELVETYDMRE